MYVSSSRILEMKSYGIIDDWIAKHRSKLRHCPDTYPNILKQKKKNVQTLSLKNFAGAFTVLGFGVSLAFCTYIAEVILHRNNKGKTKRRGTVAIQ